MLAILALAAAGTGPLPAEALTPTAAQDGERAGGRDGDDLDALVLGRAGSPALGAMRDVADLDTVRRANVGRLRPHRYDILVVDGDHLTPRELRRRPALRRFVGANKWIAAFDVRPSHHEALDTYTGFDVADGGPSDRSEMFVFRVSRIGSTPTVEMIDSGPYSQPGSARLGERRKAKLSRSHARRVARLVDRHIGTAGATAAAQQRVACPAPTPAPDPDLQHVGYCYVDAGQRPTDLGYWTFARRDFWDVYPNHGFQTSTWTMNHRFDVFLNNDAAHPRGNFQTVTYTLNGQFAPASGGKFFRMDDVFKRRGHSGTIEAIVERAWWTGQIEPKITTNEVTDSKLRWQAGHPESPNSETTYQSGEEFSVGFSGTAGNLQNVAGGGLNLNWNSSSSKSYSIPDWGVENKGSGNDLHWLFSARQPCDTRVAAANPTSCSGGFPGYRPGMPTSLSVGQIQVNASGRWQTREHLGAGNGSLTFELSTPVRIVDTYMVCRNFVGCSNANDFHYSPDFTGPRAEDVEFDVSAVNPIPIKDLKLSPNPANGAKNDKVTGTVVLERPASIPVTIKLFSNNGNAVLPAPLSGVSGGSQGAITIDSGKSSGNFTVATNDNKLSPGQHTTANITAFYTEPTSAQLRVQRP